MKALYSLIKNFETENEREKVDQRNMLRMMEMCDDVLLRSNEIAHFTASSWIVNPTRTHVLMVWHNIYKHWSWTGGHADGDPNLMQVAIREAMEETGIKQVHPIREDLYSLETITVAPHIKRGSFVPAHLHMNLTWILEADDRQSLRIKTDENSGVRWIPVEEVERMADEAEMIPIYQKLIAGMTSF